jgi:hypothetical protein
MGFLSDLFGAGGGSVPTYNTKEAQDMFKWQQNQARYNVNNPYASMSWNPDTNTQEVKYTPQMQSLLNTLFDSNSGKKAEEAAYAGFSNRYEPLFDRQSDSLQDRMVNQGIPVGSEAYSRATKDLNQQQNDARLNAQNQAVLTGQQARSNEIQNTLGTYGAFNPLSGYQPGAGTPNTDIYGNAYQGQMNAYQQNQQNAYNNANGIVGMVGSGVNLLGGMFSDARIKENLRPVGQLYNGLTVYAFNFPGEDITRIGLVAQEVEQLMPEAVSEGAEGLLMVDYDIATEYEQEAQPEQDGAQLQEAAQ